MRRRRVAVAVTVVTTLTLVINGAAAVAEPDPQYAGSISGDILRADWERASAVGNLVADAWLTRVADRADVAAVSPLSLGEGLAYDDGQGTPGAVRADQLSAIAAPTELHIVPLTGDRLLQLLEQQWQPSYSVSPFLQLSLSANLTYTYDPYRESGNKILTVTINGKPLDQAATYRVVTSTELAIGGDNFGAFTSGTAENTEITSLDALQAYLSRRPQLKPDHRVQGVATGMLPRELTTRPGEPIVISLAGIDQQAPSPATTEVTASINGQPVATAPSAPFTLDDAQPPRQGIATFTLYPSGEATAQGDHVVAFVAEPSNTTVTIPLTVTATPPFEPDPTRPGRPWKTFLPTFK